MPSASSNAPALARVSAYSREGMMLNMQELLNPNPNYARIIQKKGAHEA
jgi:hypothetical protein